MAEVSNSVAGGGLGFPSSASSGRGLRRGLPRGLRTGTGGMLTGVGGVGAAGGSRGGGGGVGDVVVAAAAKPQSFCSVSSERRRPLRGLELGGVSPWEAGISLPDRMGLLWDACLSTGPLGLGAGELSPPGGHHRGFTECIFGWSHMQASYGKAKTHYT